MDRYVKTDLGIQALKQRSFQLNARQRQLLLLIGTDDFRVLNGAMKQRLATPEIIQQLEQLGLIFQKNTAQTHPAENSFERNTYNKDIPLFENTEKSIANTNSTQLEGNAKNQQKLNNHNQSVDSSIIHNKASPMRHNQPQHEDFLDFDDIKQTMISLLKTHCGLMAKQLILKIQAAQSIREIKLCQMQWITALQETRITPSELNQNMQNINQSLQNIYISS